MMIQVLKILGAVIQEGLHGNPTVNTAEKEISCVHPGMSLV